MLAYQSSDFPNIDGNVTDWYKALCQADETKQKIMDELDAAAKEGGLKGFEKVKNIYVEPKPFDADRGLLTPNILITSRIF